MPDVNRSVYGAWLDHMTLGGACKLIDDPAVIACACIGGESCCRHAWALAKDLHRGAHILARAMTDAVASSGRGDDGAGGGDGRP